MDDRGCVGVAQQNVVAVVAVDDVVAGIAGQIVVSCAAAQIIAAIVLCRRADAILRNVVVAAYLVVAIAAKDGVFPAVAVKLVVSIVAGNKVVAYEGRCGVADYRSIAIACDLVVAIAPEKRIIGITARDHVVAIVAPDRVVAEKCAYDIVTGAGMDDILVTNRPDVGNNRGVIVVERRAGTDGRFDECRRDVAGSIAVVAVDDVVSGARDEQVLAATAEHDVIVDRTHDCVRAEAALEPFAGGDEKLGWFGAARDSGSG